MNRRSLIKSMAFAAAGAGLVSGSVGDVLAGTPSKCTSKEKAMRMPFIEAKDGTPLFYKDWGSGRPVVFVSSRAMNSDMWQSQMTPMVDQGFRCIAYD